MRSRSPHTTYPMRPHERCNIWHCSVAPLAHDAGWDEDEVKVLASTVRERITYDYGIVTDHVAALLLTGYHGLGDASDRA